MSNEQAIEYIEEAVMHAKNNEENYLHKYYDEALKIAVEAIKALDD